MTKSEKAETECKLYEVIYPMLMKYETKGWNAHQRTQKIMETVTDMMGNWISWQKKPETPS